MNGLKRKRIEKGFSLKDIAKEFGLTAQSIYYYECGKREPTLETLKKMAQFFDCTIDDLM